MKQIQLTKGAITLVDDEDYADLIQHKWHLSSRGYATRSFREGGKKYCELLHRRIIDCPDGAVVDHIDGNTLNNQKHNLRICSQHQNNMNTTSRKNTSSRFKGVTWDKSRDKWQVKLQFNGKTIHGGRYDDELESAKVYNDLALKYFGEFAKLNDIGGILDETWRKTR